MRQRFDSGGARSPKRTPLCCQFPVNSDLYREFHVFKTRGRALYSRATPRFSSLRHLEMGKPIREFFFQTREIEISNDDRWAPLEVRPAPGPVHRVPQTGGGRRHLELAGPLSADG
jgi:hypothetical protein